MESIFVVVPPRSCAPPALQKVRECLTGAGAQLETEGFIACDALQLSPRRLAVLCGNAHYWGTSPSQQVLCHPFLPTGSSGASWCPAEEDVKSLFYNHYGELWDAVVSEKRLQTACDVLHAEEISATELEELCVAAAADSAAGNVLELPTQLTITRLQGGHNSHSHKSGMLKGAPALYVVNGTYPAQQDRLFQADVNQCHFWWCSATLSDPSPSSSSSVPRTEESVVSKLGRLSNVIEDLFPSHVADVRVLENPLESLAYRATWMGAPLDRDALASEVLRRGVPLGWLEALLRDPVVLDHGHFTTVFEMVQGKCVAEAVETLVTLWADVQHSEEAEEEGVRNGVANGSLALYDCAEGYVDPRPFAAAVAKTEAEGGRKHAVAFLHPRISNHETLSRSLQQRLKEQGVYVDALRQVSCEELRAKLDAHFGCVARYALDQEALQRLVVDEADINAHFAAACGSGSWQQAMDEGRIWSVFLAEQLLGCRQAQQLMKHCLSQKNSTQQLLPALAITTVTRQALVAQNYPKTSLNDLFAANAPITGCQQPYSLTPNTFFIVNAAYGVYRHDVMAQASLNEFVGEVWQLSWQEKGDVEPAPWRWLTLAPSTSNAEHEQKGDDCLTPEGQKEVAAAYEAAVGEVVCEAFPLLGILAGEDVALRARHLWWGTPYDEDALSCKLRARGQSWLTLLPPLPQASADMAEAVLVLPPRVATNRTISLTQAALQENGVAVVEETDLYGPEAAAHVFSGSSSSLAAASVLASKSGAALWAMISHDRRTLLAEVADGIRAAADEFIPPISADNAIGGDAACVALQITLSAFEEAWTAASPRRVDRTCWVAFLFPYGVWVVNGYVALLKHKYNMETARMHLMRIRWSLASRSWADMQTALIGDAEDNSNVSVCSNGRKDDNTREAVANVASAGSLTWLLSRAIEKDGSSTEAAAVATSTSEPLCLLSPTPYDGVIDVLRWPLRGRGSPTQSEVALEDWLLRQPHIRAQLSGSVACSLTSVVQQVRETLALDVAQPNQQQFSAPQWVSRFSQAQHNTQLHHGFVWLHPSSVTPAVLEALPQLLQEHRVHIRGSGVLPLCEAVERQLLDVHHDSFYKNAFVRSAAQVPITDAEARMFASSFHQDWVKVVQLGLVLNAQEAEQKYGSVHLTTWWNNLPNTHRAQLSDQLFIGYMEEEGLYVMNPPYSYRRARLYAGGADVAWYAVEWPAHDRTWAAFMTDVVGDADPDNAAPGSLRWHFSTNWTEYRLPGKPDQIECILHASDSPLAALAERCRWLDCHPMHDPYGQVLLQSGVHPALLSLLLSNPALYTCDTGIMTEAFHLLRQDDVHQLVAQLRNYACRSGILAVPDSVPLIPPPAIPPTPKQAEASEITLNEGSSLVKQLRAYRDVVLQKAINPFQLCAFAVPFSCEDTLQTESTGCHGCAILYLDPLDGFAGREVDRDSLLPSTATQTAALRHFVEQHLRRRGVCVAHERLVRCASEAEAIVLFRRQHHRLYRYGVEVPAFETFATHAEYRVKMKQHFDIAFQSAAVVLRNAAEMAETLRGNGHDVATLWSRAGRLYPRDRLVLSGDCVVQRVHPRKPFFLVNGEALEAEQLFAATQAKAGVRVWYLRWNSQKQPNMSYAQLAQIVAGLQSARSPLRECWNTYGWAGEVASTSLRGAAAMAAVANADFCPSLHVSESSLAAVSQRQLWLGLPVCTDPVVREWCDDAPISSDNNTVETTFTSIPPRAVACVLQDPLVSTSHDGDPTHLWDSVVGMDAAHVRKHLCEWWQRSTIFHDGEREAARNFAVLALMPQVATNAAVRNVVRSTIEDNGLRIDGQGFVANCDHGGNAQVRGTVQCLFPEDWSYAKQEPHLLCLTPNERNRVEAVLQSSWSTLVDNGGVLPSLRATKRLGGMSAAQLQLFVKAAKKSLWVRPHLHLAELEEYGVCVVNAHVAYLTHVVAETAEQLPLPYYVVSWKAHQFSSWEECIARVLGSAESSVASPHSIRGRMNSSWSSLGLHNAPTTGEPMVSMSEGPVHSLLARLHLRWSAAEALDEDVLGGVLLQSLGPTVMPVLRHWLANPNVMCDDRTDGVLGHLANWETEEIVNLLARLRNASATSSLGPPLPANLAAIREEERGAEGQRAAEAAWRTAVQQRDDLPMLLRTQTAADNEVTSSASDKVGDESTSLLRHRNVGTLLFLSSQFSEAQKAQLRHHLQQHGVSVSVVAEEEEQEATPELLDRLFATESTLSDCIDLAQMLRVSEEVALTDQRRFNVVFRDDVEWAALLEGSQQRGFHSAADAMRQWQWTPRNLWTHMLGGLSMQLSEGIEVTRLPLREAEGGEPEEETATSPCRGQKDMVEVSHPGAAPWAGQYVVNGSYAALRDALRSASSTPAPTRAGDAVHDKTRVSPLLTLWGVSWDSRTLSWHDFVQRVIGCSNCERAVSGSFNALLRPEVSSNREEAAAPAEAVSPLSRLGIVPASGPLAAFAMRSRWCRNARNRYNAYVPDPFVRAMAMEGVVVDEACVDSWLSNPLVAVGGRDVDGATARCRLFDWTRGCDTLPVVQWLRTFNVTAPSSSSKNAPPLASNTVDPENSAASGRAGAAESGEEVIEPRSPPLPPPRMKKQLCAARVQDALLHARTEADWRRLWDYYGTFDTAAAATPTPDTIPFSPFYRDFKSLDTFGVPSMSHELKLLFIDVETEGRGRMTYDQFTHALSLYHSL
jgi:hypothetical protein